MAKSVNQRKSKAYARYAPQSATIQGILRDMYMTFAGDLEDSTMTEATQNKDFENLIAVKSEEKSAPNYPVQQRGQCRRLCSGFSGSWRGPGPATGEDSGVPVGRRSWPISRFTRLRPLPATSRTVHAYLI